MHGKQDISSLEDVKRLVDAFYDRVRRDDKLGEIFNHAIQDRWPTHLSKMYAFWQTVLLGEHTYHGSPFVPHAQLPVDATHFDRWMALFNGTADELFAEPNTERAKWQGERMASMFLAKINYYKNNSSIPLL